jgi:hypothetical protein
VFGAGVVSAAPTPPETIRETSVQNGRTLCNNGEKHGDEIVINSFGRIGPLPFRAAVKRPEAEIAGINDRSST